METRTSVTTVTGRYSLYLPMIYMFSKIRLHKLLKMHLKSVKNASLQNMKGRDFGNSAEDYQKISMAFLSFEVTMLQWFAQRYFSQKLWKALLLTTKLILKKRLRIILSTVLKPNTYRRCIIGRKTSLLKVLLLQLQVNSQQHAAMLKMEPTINISCYSRAS